METKDYEITYFKSQYPSFIHFIPWQTSSNYENDNSRNYFDEIDYDIGYYHKYTIDVRKRSVSCPPILKK